MKPSLLIGSGKRLKTRLPYSNQTSVSSLEQRDCSEDLNHPPKLAYQTPRPSKLTQLNNSMLRLSSNNLIHLATCENFYLNGHLTPNIIEENFESTRGIRIAFNQPYIIIRMISVWNKHSWLRINVHKCSIFLSELNLQICLMTIYHYLIRSKSQWIS